VGSETDGDAAKTSIDRVCCDDCEGNVMLDSRTLPGGVAACADWSAACTLGVKSSAAVTAQLIAGHVKTGFVTLVRQHCCCVGGAALTECRH
jgi:hypothetical protein